MSNTAKLAGTVTVDGLQYEWEVRREPQWGETDGWQGMTVALLQEGSQREAVIEFPPPKRLMKGLQRGRLQVGDAIISRGIRAALLAGWEPTSRGKPVVFMVDADGN
ncbi:hypothetical protein [Sphingomonas crocodyli]|uniref:Uncharacterized protein n=1 Tax=Sphingomonas crocodyli TaxID=1979270 RepID=A0A437M4B3_9SPHN|nr:hypothetical protein [Sphingomonas crocodyli]RVT92492.1 hypothetical protein EOD43_00735 [Sphingomonas crocodyli]